MIKNNLLIIFIKAPGPGDVKTRLLPYFTSHQATMLYRSMVTDLLSHFSNPSGFEVRLMYWPPDAQKEIRNWLGTEWDAVPQTKGDLGEKMQQAFHRALAEGYQKVVLIGSDLPMLDQDTIHDALHCLEEFDAVVGPTDDGGYYLIGARKALPGLFRNIKWSSNRVLDQSLGNAQEAHITVSLLEEKFDIDRYEDVLRLWQHLKTGQCRQRLPNTFNVLNLMLREI